MFIDTCVAIIVSLGFYLGYQRGLIKTIFDTLSLFIGILAAIKLSPWMMELLGKLFNMSKPIELILGIALTFLIVMWGIRFIGKKIEAILETVNINVINKVAGGVIQALFFAAILSYAVSLMDKVNVIKEETKTTSATYTSLMKMPAISEALFVSLKPVFSEFWSKTNEAIDSMKKKTNEVQ
jgi:membrane protein required for colicin V production